jgi:hypothetical protein
MKEQQVHPEPFVVDPQPPLSPDKRELVPQFEQKSLEMADQRLFQIAFGVFILKKAVGSCVGIRK